MEEPAIRRPFQLPRQGDARSENELSLRRSREMNRRGWRPAAVLAESPAVGALASSLFSGAAAAAPQAGQTPAPGRATAVKPSKPANLKTSWTPPRTPWGDPDLQGSFTN